MIVRKLPVGAAFGHVLRSTFHNLSFAWHLSWPWLLVIFPINIVVNVYGVSERLSLQESSKTAIAITIVLVLVSAFAFSSIAIGWHRYILLDEIPRGWSRLRIDAAVWQYFGYTLLLFLNFAAGLFVVLVVGVLLRALVGEFMRIPSLLAYIAAVLYSVGTFYRLGVKLPAISLERKDFRMSDAWTATEGNHVELMGLGLLFSLSALALALVVATASWGVAQMGVSFLVFISMAVQIIFHWIVTIMGVTLLTSLYGFFVEKRDF